MVISGGGGGGAICFKGQGGVENDIEIQNAIERNRVYIVRKLIN